MNRILSIFSLLIIIGCSNGETNNNFNAEISGFKPKTLAIKKERTLEFENDTIVGLYGNIKVLKVDNNEVIYGTNFMMNRIEKFDFDEGYIGSILFEENENLKRISWSESLFINKDSIFLFGDAERLALIDDQGNFKQSWNFSRILKRNDNIEGIDPINNDLSFFIRDNSIFFRTYPKYNWDTDWKYYTKPFMVQFDLVNSKILKSLGDFPAYMYDNRHFKFVNDHKMSWVLTNDGSLVYSLRRDPYLYKLNLRNGEMVKIPAQASAIKNFELVPRIYDSQRDTNYLITKGIYHRILYDRYRDLYYRVVTHEQPLKSANGRLNNAAKKVFTLVVLDAEFNYLGEAVFEDKDNYSYLNFDICSEGLIFPIYDGLEDVVTFEIYNIVL